MTAIPLTIRRLWAAAGYGGSTQLPPPNTELPNQTSPFQQPVVTMSSRGSSRSSSLSKESTKKSFVSNVSTEDFRFNVLEPHNIFVADGVMGMAKWADLAFSLGISARAGHCPNVHAQKLCQKMNKKKSCSSGQTYELFRPLIESLVSTCPRLSQRERTAYHSDAIPQCEALRNTTHRLPVPKPAISIGYHREVFSADNAELQTGIISGSAGEPHNLDHISQPIGGHYWPFLVVEFSDHSMTAAQQASAVTAATLNNGMSLVADAAAEESKEWEKPSFTVEHGKLTRCFSLSIHDKVACLSTHSLVGPSAHLSTQICDYRMDDERAVTSLTDRLRSIMIWGQHGRLEEISAILDQLNRKVHGDSSDSESGDAVYDFDPQVLKTSKFQFSRRPDIVKIAFRAGLPGWLKA